MKLSPSACFSFLAIVVGLTWQAAALDSTRLVDSARDYCSVILAKATRCVSTDNLLRSIRFVRPRANVTLPTHSRNNVIGRVQVHPPPGRWERLYTSPAGRGAVFLSACARGDVQAMFLALQIYGPKLLECEGMLRRRPLHIAASHGRVLAVRYLVQLGSGVPHELNREDWAGCSPLSLAAMHGHAGVVRELVLLGADASHASAFRWMFSYPVLVGGFTPLHWARSGGTQAHDILAQAFFTIQWYFILLSVMVDAPGCCPPLVRT